MSFAAFSDIAMPDLGWHGWHPIDKCFELLVPFTDDRDLFTEALLEIRIRSGRDAKEAQLIALQHAARGDFFSPQPLGVIGLSVTIHEDSHTHPKSATLSSTTTTTTAGVLTRSTSPPSSSWTFMQSNKADSESVITLDSDKFTNLEQIVIHTREDDPILPTELPQSDVYVDVMQTYSVVDAQYSDFVSAESQVEVAKNDTAVLSPVVMGGTDAPDMHSLPFTDATSADGNPSKLIRQGDTRRAPGYAVDPTAAVDSAVTFRRVIILSTDSPYHEAGDALAMQKRHGAMRKNPQKSWYMPRGDFEVWQNDGNAHLSCEGKRIEDYPSVRQVAEALKDVNAIAVFFVSEAVKGEYQRLRGRLASEGFFECVVVEVEHSVNSKPASRIEALEAAICPEVPLSTAEAAKDFYDEAHEDKSGKSNRRAIIIGTATAATGAAAAAVAVGVYASNVGNLLSWR
eukprot:Lankesteria_metandrocarpae@DN5333_c2_g1_i2.p1